jgi:hypothetical protein
MSPQGYFAAKKVPYLPIAEKISSLSSRHIRGAVQWMFDLFRSDVSNVISRKCWSKERSRNIPQRSWCKDTIIRISYYLVQRVCNHWKGRRGHDCRLQCNKNRDR